MKKKQLETLEKMNEERKLNKEIKEKIAKKALKNLLFATGILFLFTILKLMAIRLDKQIASLIYKEISIGLFIVTLFLFEVAYKKDDDNLAITSIEMFFLSTITLLAPYLLISRESIYTSLIGVYFSIYYAIKNLILYRNEKSDYLNQKSDITEIVKKESQDKLAQEQLEKTREDLEKEEKPVKRGRGRPRKATSETTKTTEKNTKISNTTTKKSAKSAKTTTNKTTKTTDKVEEKQTEEQPKRKRGRPKKINS